MNTGRMAIIPARGGSKRIPRKNIKTFAGQPILSYPLKAAADSGLFEKIHVSTDCDETAALAESRGYPVDFFRDTELCDDFTPLKPVLRWVVECFEARGEYYDSVVLVMPCSPFLSIEDLNGMVSTFDRHGGSKPVIGVREYSAPVEWAYDMNKKTGELTAVDGSKHALRSQDISSKVHDAGSVIVFGRAHLFQDDDAQSETVGYKLNKYFSIDIDDQDDWDFAERLYRSIHG